MPIWKVRSISEQPSIALARWRVLETQTGARHLVGWNIEDAEGRVSSALTGFDQRRLRGVTQSGRTYQLEGEPGYDADAQEVWNGWRVVNSVSSERDVSRDVWAQHL